MCGIAGYVGKKPLLEGTINQTLESLKRRGPDAFGVKHLNAFNQFYSLFHTRLKIIDLDNRSNQPFIIGHYHFLFNGELYNYKEIRKSLEAKGESFFTDSDTEVFLKLIIKEGLGALDQCEGMWSFALLRADTGDLYLSRDRFGEKPLYYYQSQNSFSFSSEVKAIAKIEDKKFKINDQHLKRYLINGYKSLYKSNATFFHEINEVGIGEILHLNRDGQIQRWKYWNPTFSKQQDMTFRESVDGVRERLIKSMELRLRSDVPIAFCMSGGVDSNSLICIAKKIFNYDVHGFTVVNKDARYEEISLVQKVVDEFKLKHSSVEIKRDHFLENLKELISYHDAPVYTISYYAHWLMMKEIAKFDYKISVSGTAADELFSGYYDHHNAYLYDMRNHKELYDTSMNNWNEHQKNVVRNPFLQKANLFLENPFERGYQYLEAELFSQVLHQPWSEPFNENFYSSELLRNRMLNELFHESIPVILHEDDLNSMYYSIENRSPFLDRELFEFSLKIPTKYFVQEGMAKFVLRSALKDIVPDSILFNRKKVGFNAPLEDFIQFSDPQVQSELLADSPIFDIVNRDKIKSYFVDRVLSNSESKFLFNFLNAKYFLEKFH